MKKIYEAPEAEPINYLALQNIALIEDGDKGILKRNRPQVSLGEGEYDDSFMD